MASYVIGILEGLERHMDIVQYLKAVDSTIAPFGGRFLVHGPRPEIKEGRFKDTLIIIEFPDLRHVRRWYASPAYQAIIPLRAAHSTSNVFFVEGVPSGYAAADLTQPGRTFDPSSVPQGEDVR